MLDGTAVVIVNSAFCAYDNELGFRIVPPELGGWSSQPGERKRRNSQGGFSYQLESYAEHIGTMLQVYRDRFAADYAYIQARLAQQWGLPPDALENAVRLAIALHDVAKMDERWQRWVRLYQKGIGEEIFDPAYMAVHTHWNPSDPQHVKAKKEANRLCERPPHAAEGAMASARIIAAISGVPDVGYATMTAIARHHNAGTDNLGDYRLHTAAGTAAMNALKLAGFPPPAANLIAAKPATNLDQVLIKPGEFRQVLLYFWVVRMLRLCDGISQEEN